MVLKRVERWKGQWRGQHTVLESLTTRGGSAAVVVSLVTRELGVENDVHICAACPDVCRIAVTNVAAMGKGKGSTLRDLSCQMAPPRFHYISVFHDSRFLYFLRTRILLFVITLSKENETIY